MKLLAGLGNPGPRYADSRHNVGYLVIDELARRWGMTVTRYDRRFQGLIGQATRAGHQVHLLKPTTFMNLSGQSVSAVLRYFKLGPSDLLVIHDDLDLLPGQVRVRAGGSAGGHKGLDDIIRHLSTTEVPRLRIGIGKVHRDATVDFVLSRFTPAEREIITEAVATAANAVECWLARGITAAMNEFNRKQAQPSDAPDDARPEGE